MAEEKKFEVQVSEDRNINVNNLMSEMLILFELHKINFYEVRLIALQLEQMAIEENVKLLIKNYNKNPEVPQEGPKD